MIIDVLVHFFAAVGIGTGLLVVIVVRDFGQITAGYDRRRYDAADRLRSTALRIFHGKTPEDQAREDRVWENVAERIRLIMHEADVYAGCVTRDDRTERTLGLYHADRELRMAATRAGAAWLASDDEVAT